MTPDDIANLEYVSSAKISSDGGKIAYTVVKQADPTKENVAASLHLWVYDLETKTSTPFITQGSVTGVAFRPRHESITFLTRRDDDKTTSLYEIPLTGGEAIKVLEFESSITSYEWSPEGQQVVFLAKEKTDKIPVLPYEPIIYEENLLLTRAYLASPGETPKLLPIEGQCYAAHWSPDGSKLSISSAPTALVDDSYMKQSINILEAASMQTLNRLEPKAKLGSFAWSTDSKKLAYIAGSDIHDPTAGRLWVTDIIEGTPENLQPGFKGKFEAIQWIDSKTIQFLASEGVYTTLGQINANGKKLQKVIDKGNTALSSFSSSALGTTALVGSTGDHPNELFILEGNSLSRLTQSNNWLAERKLGKQEVINYKAKDGLELEGLLILPVDYREGTRYPLITVVHGGPESHYKNGWLTAYSSPGHMGAANGYMVFYPNYRGSSGRGEQFAKSSQCYPG